MQRSILFIIFIILTGIGKIFSVAQASPLPLPRLITQYGCQSCHAFTDQRAAPSFHAIALRYQTQAGARLMLIQKLRRGGSGVWGSTQMPPQIMVADEDAGKVIDWILQQNHAIGSNPSHSSVKKDR
ncbi:MAG: hypothetical protein V4525_00280 [Pseudomonadota bacterium]